MALTVGSLFSGIGGIDLGLERAGMVTRWFCEIDPHCRNVLARHWPGVPIYGDITAVDWSGVEPVDVLAGGFPCQPVSLAGHGRAQEDERWLWGAFRDAIGVLRPRYILVENVPGLLQRGLGIVLGDLASLGYDAEWECIPAAAVGAPHLRDRLWMVAYPARVQPGRAQQRTQRERAGASSEPIPLAHTTGQRRDERPRVGSDRWTIKAEQTGLGSARIDVAHATGNGRIARRSSDATQEPRGRESRGSGVSADALVHANGTGLEGRTLQPERPSEWTAGPFSLAYPDSESLGRLAESRGQRGQWLTEPDVGRVANGVPHRVDRLRSLGNAVVPQVVEWIGARIVAFDESRNVSAA